MKRIKRRWMSGLVFLMVFAALTALAAQERATRIVRFVPDALAARSDRLGNCWTGSIASPRPDAWRCMVGNEIFDPCFSPPHGNLVVCDANPAKGVPGFRLNLTGPLPKQDMPAGSSNLEAGSGWLIQLADGALCRPSTGASGMVGGKVMRYYCESRKKGQYVSLLDDLDSSKPLWTAEKATTVMGPQGPKLIKSERIGIRIVWQ